MPLYCQSKSIPIAVLGNGAHSPYGMADDAVVIDLMRMTAVRVDPEKKLAFVQAGADGGDVDHETALHNLIVSRARSPTRDSQVSRWEAASAT